MVVEHLHAHALAVDEAVPLRRRRRDGPRARASRAPPRRPRSRVSSCSWAGQHVDVGARPQVAAGDGVDGAGLRGRRVGELRQGVRGHCGHRHRMACDASPRLAAAGSAADPDALTASVELRSGHERRHHPEPVPAGPVRGRRRGARGRPRHGRQGVRHRPGGRARVVARRAGAGRRAVGGGRRAPGRQGRRRRPDGARGRQAGDRGDAGARARRADPALSRPGRTRRRRRALPRRAARRPADARHGAGAGRAASPA